MTAGGKNGENCHQVKISGCDILLYYKVRVNIWCISCQKRSVEALKERYYSVCNRLSRARDPNIEDSQLIAYDAPHECRRKMQLEKLLNRWVCVSVSVDKEQNSIMLALSDSWLWREGEKLYWYMNREMLENVNKYVSVTTFDV